MTRGQLALELPVELPAIAIEPEWKAQQRLWGHSLHPMCSYLASFPAALTHAFIARYTRPGDVVLDPFSGRGTTPLQACAEGRIGVGNDLNPFAHLLTASKVQPATRAAAVTRLTALRLAWAADAPRWHGAGRRPIVADPVGGGPEPVPLEVVVAFHPSTFAQLLFLRDALDLDDRTDRFLAAATTGILHGKSAELPVRAHAQHVQHGPALRPRLRAQDRLRVTPSATCSTAWPPSSTACTASPCRRPRASPCSATRATWRRGPEPRCGPPADPTGPGSWSPPRPTCGS